MKTELFQLGPKIIWAMSDAEVSATCDALRELGIYRLPYEEITIRVLAKEVVNISDKSGNAGRIGFQPDGTPIPDALYLDITISEIPGVPPHYVAYNAVSGFTLDLSERAAMGGNGKSGIRFRLRDEPAAEWLDLNTADHAERARQSWCDLMVALLATRNSVKTRTEDKLAKLGIGRKKYKHRYRYTTTILLPEAEDMESDAEHPPTHGGKKAPHLRRGHVRRQHFGPQRAFVKRVFIEPVFVNADHDFVSTREAYNFSGPARTP